MLLSKVFAQRLDLKLQSLYLKFMLLRLFALQPSAFPSPLQFHRSPVPVTSRHFAIALLVVLVHAGLIYGLQNGWLMRVAERPAPVVPMVILSRLIEPPRPIITAEAPPPPPPLVPPPRKATAPPTAPATTPATNQATAKAPSAVPAQAPLKSPVVAAPLPLATNNPTPAANAPTGTTDPQPPKAQIVGPIAATVAAAPASPSAVQLPLSDADYLQNPLPPYPAISRRLNEQGTTVMRVWIGADGLPQRAEISTSSGFSRLDSAASTTVMRWRYVPGKRGGIPEAMWISVPVVWVLN